VWKDAEILLLRHQVALLEPRSAARPKPTRAGRALIAALPAVYNEDWGYRRITGGSRPALGITVAPSTVWEIRRRHGIDPAPRRSGPSWSRFPRSRAEAIIADGFFTVGLLGGTKAYVLAVIEHTTRRIHVPWAPPPTPRPSGSVGRPGTCSWS
jgi:hypothetical protein